MRTSFVATESMAALELMSKTVGTREPVVPVVAPPTNQQCRTVFLPRTHAMSFSVREDTCLRLTRGRLWITFEAPQTGLAPRNGDHFIGAGAVFDLLAGETAVLEPVGDAPGAWLDLVPVRRFSWRAAAQLAWANVHRIAARQAGGSRQGGQPHG